MIRRKLYVVSSNLVTIVAPASDTLHAATTECEPEPIFLQSHLLEDAAIGETRRRREKRMGRIVRGFLDDYKRLKVRGLFRS
ncbi:hypothetical protein ACQEVC_07920 [Plantactinospora sp. CA-294935]|uniref:hypothetical protein n=1 Tax=Plantactinospora sp. CA-294935 TaxID=3240012 RepID=UPI003D8D7359